MKGEMSRRSGSGANNRMTGFREPVESAVTVTDPSIRESGVAQAGLLVKHIRSSQPLRLGQIYTFQASVIELRILQVSTKHGGVAEISTREIRAIKIGIGQIGTAELRFAEICSGENGVAQVGIIQNRPLQACATQILPTEVHAGEFSPRTLCPWTWAAFRGDG